MYNIFATSFHEFGLRLTVFVSLLILQGPCSWKRPIILELPGPPFNHIAKGAVSALLRAAKYQNHILSLEVRSPYPDAWYTPGVVSHTPLFSMTRSLPGVVAAGTEDASNLN